MPLAIQLRQVTRRYPSFALNDVSLDVSVGRVLGLIGPNGAGKSTLLRILMGLVRQDRGTVTVLGRTMPADEAAVKARVGWVSDDMSLYGAATLRWHMDLVREFYDGWDERRSADLAHRFELNPAQRIRGMSRGQQVKAALLLAMARQTDLLILDEPTTGLDPLVRHDLLRLLMEWRDEHRTMVFSSHNGADVASLADDVAFLLDGRIVAHEPVGAFVRDGKTLESAFLEHVGANAGGRAA